MKTLVSIIFFISLVHFACAQPHRSLHDSIKNVLKNAKTDTATCAKLLYWLEDLSPADHETAVLVAKWVVKAAEKSGDQKQLAKALYGLGRCYQVIDDYKTAIKYFKKVARLAEKNKLYETQAALYDCFASIYSASREYKLAEQYYIKSIKLAEKKHFKKNLAASYYNLASLYYQAQPDTNYVEKALLNINTALQIADSATNWDVIAYALWLKSTIYEESLKSDSSEFFIDKAYEIAMAHNLIDFYNPYYQHKGIMLCKKSKFKEGEDLFKKGLKNAELTHSFMWQYNFYELLSLSAAEQGNYKAAYEYRLQHKMYYDSLVNSENFAKVNDLETQLKFEKKEKEKKISDLLLQKSEQRQRSLWIFIALIAFVAVILTIFMVVLIRNIRARKEAYLKLQQKNIEIQEQGEELAKLSGEITKYQAQMNPHFVFNALNSIQGFVVNNEKEKTLQQLGTFSKLMRTTLNNSNHQLIPVKNEIEYLKTFIAFEQERFRNKISLEIISTVDENETMIPPMMIQPLLENALKHARLGDVNDATISINITEEKGLLKICVTDNGKGIQANIKDVIKQSHSMSIIKSRIELGFSHEKAELPSAYFSITSVPDLPRGTRIEFYLPLMTQF